MSLSQKTLLSSSTTLPDEVEDELTGSSTLDFERQHGIAYGENSMLIPSVNAYDLPVLTQAQFGALIARSESMRPVADLVAHAVRTVATFDESGAERIAEFARRLLEATNSIALDRE